MRLTVYHGYGDSSVSDDFDVYLNNHCNDNFSDIRFLREGGVQWLDYWIEEYTTGDNATVWVEFDQISTGGTNFSVFYSNPGASSESDGEKTWDFFDDFPGSSVNSTKWDTINSPGGTVADSELTISKAETSFVIVHGYQTNTSFDDCRMVARGQTGHSQGQASSILISQYNGKDCLNKVEFRNYNDLWLRTDLRDCGGSNTNNVTNSNFALDTYYTYYYVREGTDHVRAWEDGAFVGQVTTNIRDASDPGAILVAFWGGVPRTQDIVVDWYGVGKYCDPEPAWGNWSPCKGEPLIPPQIDDLAAVAQSGSSIELTWTTNANQFDVRYSTSQITNESQWDAAQQCVDETASPYNVTGLAPNTAYYFRMKAAYSDIGEWNAYSNQASDTTQVSYCPYSHNYTFVDLCDGKQGYESDVDVFPFGGDAGNRNTYLEVGTSFEGVGGYEDIAANNSAEWVTEDPDTDDYIVTWWRMYVNHSISAVTNIRFRWNGNSAGGLTNHSMWVLRNDSRDDWELNSAWDYLGYVNITESADTDVTSWINSSIGDYVDARDGKITFLIENAYRASQVMRTNFVEMRVIGNPVCGDITAPAAIGSMNATVNSGISVDLDWIAPGDDSILGTASEYDIRHSTAGAINEGNWGSATQVANEKTPQSAGKHEYFTVSGLDQATDYWFAIKTSDEVPQWSEISNSPGDKTSDPPPGVPGPVKDLSASGMCNNIKLTWSAPGSTGYGGTSVDSYDIRYSTAGPIFTKAIWDAATQCAGEPAPGSPGSQQTFNQSFLDSNAATTYWFAIKSTDDGDTSTLSLTSPSAQPNHGDLRGTEWWLWQIYYNSEEGTPEVNTVYHIANVRAASQTATVDYSPLDNPDDCVFPGYNLSGSAVIDWSCDQGGDETDPTRERRVNPGLTPAPVNSELMMDSEIYVDGDDATLWVDVNALPRSFQTAGGFGDGDIPTDYLYSYQHDSIPPEESYPPGADDGYPFVDGEDDWKQWVWGDASGDNILLDDQEQEKGYNWEVDSPIASYNVDANCEAPAATGVFDVIPVNRTNTYFLTHDIDYGQNNSPDSDTTQYWYNCSVKNFVRLLDKITYEGREDWGIVNYEARNLSASVNEFSDAGTGFDINVTITNNEDTAGNFSVLVLIMDMDAVTDDTWSDGETYPGGETVYPNMSDWTSISEAIQYTGNLGSGSNTQVTWSDVGDSSGTPEYKLWVTGATATIN